MDWEICIDGAAYEKYKMDPDILLTVAESEDGPCFVLRGDGRCPHLNRDGLCEIILSRGEGYLSQICREHPRFYNHVGAGRVEAGLGIVCEEACRLILENGEPFSLVKVGESEVDHSDGGGYDALPLRDYIIAFIEGEGGFDEKLACLKEDFVIPEPYTADEWISKLLALEVLEPSWTEDLTRMADGITLDAGSSDFVEYERYYERLLTYFVYRHVSSAECETDLRARLGFALLSTEVVRALFEHSSAHSLDRLIDWSRRYSSEIEYSTDNTAELIAVFEDAIYGEVK